MHAPEAQRGGYSPHSVRLAWILALAYLLVIVHASLLPYRGWRMPPDEILGFLTAPWPHYTTLGDIIVNLAAYMPLGFLASIGWGARRGAGPGVFHAALCAAGLSLVMESAQMFLPARIASNVDLLANSLGALIGAMAAPLFAPTRNLGGKLHALRHRLFVEGMAADGALVVACLWLVTQFHPTAQLFGTGSLRATFDLPAYFVHAPQIAFSFEAAVVLLNLLGAGLMISAFMRGGSRRMLAIGAVIGTALLAKTAAATLIKAAAPFAWLTPGVSLGLLAGWLLLHAAAGEACGCGAVHRPRYRGDQPRPRQSLPERAPEAHRRRREPFPQLLRHCARALRAVAAAGDQLSPLRAGRPPA